MTLHRFGRAVKLGSVALIAIIAILTAIHFPREVGQEAPDASMEAQSKPFYDKAFGTESEKTAIASVDKSYDHPDPVANPEHYSDPRIEMRGFVEAYKLQDKHVLEIGAGTGYLQDIVPDYTGLDISATAHRYYHKPFLQASATKIPVSDNQFDVIWSLTTLEHVPNPELALKEMRRVLKSGGILYLEPTWQCRTWFAEGYAVRPYQDFNFMGKLNKASIPLRNTVLYRALYIFPIRGLRFIYESATAQPTHFRYTALAPNYTHMWQNDSDAVNSMDPYEAILWFTSRGDECLNYPTKVRQFFVRNGAVIVRVKK